MTYPLSPSSLQCTNLTFRSDAAARDPRRRRQSRKAKPVTLSLITSLKSHWKDNETARQIARLTDRELADIGAQQIGGRILSMAQNYRVADGLRGTQSPLRYASFPSA